MRDSAEMSLAAQAGRAGLTYSRRDVLRTAGIGGAGLGAAAFLAACGSSGTKSSAGTKVSSAWAKGPVSFVFLDTTEPSTLDPSVQTEFDGMLITRNTYDALTFTDETTGKLTPWLATSWSPNQDVTQWAFKIRSGVHFQDGSALDAAAVALSMQRHLAIGSVAQAGYMLAGISSVTATGPMEVTFTTKAPQPWLPYHMTMFPVISQQAIDSHKTSSDPWAKAWFADNCAGTGPYELSSWVKGTKITLNKNPHWWNGPWPAGSIDDVTVQWESSPSTTVELIEKGTANFATEWSIDNALSVGQQPGFTLKRYRAYNTDPVIAFNQAKPPFDKKEVRQAFQYAFDYSAMRAYFRGYAVPTSGVLPSFNPYALKSLPVYKQDLGKAKSLLAQAGVSPADITSTCYSAAGYPDLVAGGTILQSSLAQIGVHIKVQAVPFGTIESAVTQLSTSPPLTSALYNGIFSIDPTTFLSSFLPKSFGNEFMQYNSPALVAAYNKASSSPSQADVKAGLNEAQQIIADDAPVIFGAVPELIIPVPDYLEGYVMQQTDDQYPCLFFQLRLHEH
jgi:peptide/nickel transport system substrate-binding protein